MLVDKLRNFRALPKEFSKWVVVAETYETQGFYDKYFHTIYMVSL
jgi:hypothetical protein